MHNNSNTSVPVLRRSSPSPVADSTGRVARKTERRRLTLSSSSMCRKKKSMCRKKAPTFERNPKKEKVERRGEESGGYLDVSERRARDYCVGEEREGACGGGVALVTGVGFCGTIDTNHLTAVQKKGRN